MRACCARVKRLSVLRLPAAAARRRRASRAAATCARDADSQSAATWYVGTGGLSATPTLQRCIAPRRAAPHRIARRAAPSPHPTSHLSITKGTCRPRLLGATSLSAVRERVPSQRSLLARESFRAFSLRLAPKHAANACASRCCAVCSLTPPRLLYSQTVPVQGQGCPSGGQGAAEVACWRRLRRFGQRANREDGRRRRRRRRAPPLPGRQRERQQAAVALGGGCPAGAGTPRAAAANAADGRLNARLRARAAARGGYE